ncbi:DUF6580 family putative transport protein [Kangiella sediminilitoris]|uniref:Rod shape-determining protein MreD n=1 Tax=Kangiella sediminilitoris TaxID=1144748 RepID=A0A1B3B9R5_9GAMM|nr:DUF6580 family putative transport protein [Kangiella sediminilitoris]AOE49537.1 hypothetical protein KS2013_814 [Kangiella sediminilitoris]
MMSKLQVKTFSLIAIIVAIGLYRLFPHPFNVTPVMAMGLFAGTYFDKKWLAFVIPVASMLMADIFLGFHATMVFVYAAILLAVSIGFLLRRSVSPLKVIAASTCGSIIFFVVTNFGVWWVNDYYPNSWEGLVTCYTMAIPFFQRTLLGDLLFNGVLFVSYWYFSKAVSVKFLTSH